MQNKQTLLSLFVLFVSIASFSQTTYLPQNAEENILLERLEIKAGTDSVLNFSKTKPFSRKQFIPVIDKYYRVGSVVKSVGEIPANMDSEQHKRLTIAASLTNVDLY